MSHHGTLCLGALVLAGCNLVSGADGIDIVEGTATASSGAGPVDPVGPGSGGATSSGGLGGAGGDATVGAGATGGGGPSTGAGASGGGSPCPPCAANEQCEVSTGSCVCDPGFIPEGGSCVPAPVGDPATRTEQEVCDAWSAGRVITDANPHMANGMDCDAGTLSQLGLNDTLVRINMYRWLNGLDPVSDDAAYNEMAQACANIASWWPFTGGNAHNPPASSKCYTTLGAQGAGSSNIAWGSNHPAPAIDQFMEDFGASNALTMGHRRWIINPSLGKVGIGYWETGGLYGNAQCLRVFDQSGGGPSPSWSAVPNQGFVPLTIARWTWTFHGSLGGISNATVSVLRVSDNTTLPVTMQPLDSGYGQPATSWVPDGWQAQAGETYRVTVSNLTGPDVEYDVKPTACN